MHRYQPLFEALWQQYCAVTPSAAAIHQLLGQGLPLVNDHIALRTFAAEPLGLNNLAQAFIDCGYVAKGEYHFEAKKLYARHFEHPDAGAPKVFISELLVAQCSPTLQQIVAGLLQQLPASLPLDLLPWAGRLWQLSQAEYQTLAAESEYAAWLAAWGFRANHFTVSVNALAGQPTLAQVNQRLQQAGFRLNCSGGEIKGSAQACLEQSSTLADRVEVEFSDGRLEIPGCFYEFARRYPLPSGELYSGFVAASADKIFESTDSNS